MKKIILTILSLVIIVSLFTQCNLVGSSETKTEPMANGGYETQAKWGEHLVAVSGCTDCHTPKKMTEKGPVPDEALLFSGHTADMPKIEVNRMEMQKLGLVVTRDLTEWIGPWGVSYATNLTPDETGTGNWKEEQFIRALKEGKYKGLADARTLLPPMPWEQFKHFTDDEVKAIFAYFKTVKPIKNLVPQPLPPVGM